MYRLNVHLSLYIVGLLKFMVTSNRTTPQESFYFKEASLKKIVNDINDVTSFRNVTVYYNSTVYVEKIKIIYDISRDIGPVRIAILKNDLRTLKPCPKIREFRDEYEYECNDFSRLLIINAEVNVDVVLVDAFQLYLENYVGCFESPVLDDRGVQVREVSGCYFGCHKQGYFGIRSNGHCICIGNLSLMIPVELNRCNRSCLNNPYQLCGSDNYYSVYAREFQSNSTPSWSCIVERNGCTVCENGRMGTNCELIECTRESIACMTLKCQNFTTPFGVDVGVCTCPPGFYIDSARKCLDVDECSLLIRCDSNTSVCSNTIGSYECQCKEGFQMAAAGSCRDIDECLTSSVCDEMTTICTNVFGDFQCSCKEGYSRTKEMSAKSSCRDIDECQPTLSYCPENIACTNSLGSYECACPEGTIGVRFPYFTECQDVDECIKIDICNETVSICINTKSSYVCGCRPGYKQVDNFTCAPSETVDQENMNSSTESQTTPVYDEEAEFNDMLKLYLATFILLIVFVITITVVVLAMKQRKEINSSLSTTSTTS